MRITLAGAALLCAVSTGRAQDFRPSQRAEMTQWIAKTEIQLRYIRPVARGRELFGKLVPLGKPWTPSADSAMRISFSTDVRINGQALAAGAYTVWAIPDSAQWTLIYNKRDRLFHMRTYVESDDALKVTAKVETLPHIETLLASFPTVEGRKATFRIQWGPTAVSVETEVP